MCLGKSGYNKDQVHENRMYERREMDYEKLKPDKKRLFILTLSE